MIHGLLLFLGMLVAHAVCDYPLQGDFLAKAKNPTAPIPGVPWWWAMGAHAAIHAGGVFVVTGSVSVSVAEFVAHWRTDRLKCEGSLSFTGDQVMHILWKACWAALVVGGAP